MGNEVIKKDWMPPRTPSLAVDCVILRPTPAGRWEVALIQRKFPPLGLALPGGFVEVGETCASAAAREASEEVGFRPKDEDLHKLDIWDDPKRDPRGGHVVTVGFLALVGHDTKLVAGDDARSCAWHDAFGIIAGGDKATVLGHHAIVTVAVAKAFRLVADDLGGK